MKPTLRSGVCLASILIVSGFGCSSNDDNKDAGTSDAGSSDAGTTDGGSDAGPSDAGPDAGFVAAVTQTNLVSDQSGMASHEDANLVNAWGLASSATGPWWVSDNGTGVSTLYDSSGAAQSLVVTIPPSGNAQVGETPAPTGVAFNNSTNFMSDVFIFATEDGTIAGWQTGAMASLRVDNSGSGSVYKGIAVAGGTLFATNFHAGTVEKYDSTYAASGTFTDNTIPSGFAPFNVANLNGHLYVSYAKQDAAAHDDVPGAGNGFIDVFDLTGANPQRLVSNGPLNSPWGMAIAPADFGAASNKLLVGNFGGDNFINVFDPTSGTHLGHLTKHSGGDLAIDGLWSIVFGNDGQAGPHNTLFFTAGPGGEAHGLFGSLVLSP